LSKERDSVTSGLDPNETGVESLVRGFFEEAINTGDLSAFDRYCGENYVWHGGADPGGLGDVSGLDNFKDAVAMFFNGFPDLKVEILDMLVDGDKAAVRFRETGTHLGPFVGIAATGNVVSFAGMGIYRAEGGQLVEEWFVDDSRAIFEQIGAIPVIREADD
jgi:predicted ester cyclase